MSKLDLWHFPFPPKRPKRFSILRSFSLGILVAAGLFAVDGWCCVACAQDVSAQARTQGLSEPVHRAHYADFSGVFVPHALMPKWDRGYLVFRTEVESTAPLAPSVVLFDRNGTRVREGMIWFSGARRVSMSDAAATEVGEIVVAGHALMPDGNMFYVAKTDLAGTVIQVVRTNPFVPRMVCAASDGTVWSFGQEPSGQSSGPDYPMLRQYSFAEGLLRQYLPRNSFPPGIPPSVIEGTPQGSYLRCAKDRVALYVNPTNEYVEIDLSSYTEQRWKVDMPSLGPMQVTGFAVTDTGHVYGSLDQSRSGGNPGFTGLFELVTVRGASRARWVPVDGTVAFLDRKQGIPPGTLYRLWGTDGQNLIIVRSGNPGLTWVTPIFEPASR